MNGRTDSAASPRPWCECDPDYDGRCPYPCQIDADEKREAASAASAASSRASAEQIVEASSTATVLREIERLVVSQGHRNPAATLDAVESLAVGYRLAVARTEDDNQARDEDRPILGGECECGWPKQPCLRKVLGNGPPFPPEPCEPKVTPNA